MKSLISPVLIVLLAAQVLFVACSPDTDGRVTNGPVTNQNTGLRYPTIQEAIDAPQTRTGHSLIIASGTFTENIVINKDITVMGTSAASTVLRALDSNIDTVSIVASGVTVKELTIKGATGRGSAGIRLSDVTGVLVDSCTVTDNFRGIYLVSSSDNTITRCNIIANIENGIVFYSSSDGNRIIDNTVANTIGGVGEFAGNGVDTGDQGSSSTIISGNIIRDNARAGITAYLGSDDMEITGNSIYGNGGSGIQLGWSVGCIIERNIITNNNIGMQFDTASGNIFRNNTVSDNTVGGILMMGLGQTGNLIENNRISGNGESGIRTGSTMDTIIRFNTIAGHQLGLWIGHNPPHKNYGNRIYNNNFIENTIHARDDSPETDHFDNGLPQGGNHWDNWTAPDENKDGFVDNPYPIAGGYSQDNFPYVRRSGWVR